MLVNFESGNTFSCEEITDWLPAAHGDEIRAVEAPGLAPRIFCHQARPMNRHAQGRRAVGL
jgi:hypothetical protein